MGLGETQFNPYSTLARIIEDSIQPMRWAEVSSAEEEVRRVPGGRDPTCKVSEEAEKTRSAFWNERGQKCLARGRRGVGCGQLRLKS